MKDEAGSLAKIAKAFGDNGISLVYGEAVIVEKGKTAIWTVVGGHGDLGPEELEALLLGDGDALKVEIIPLE